MARRRVRRGTGKWVTIEDQRPGEAEEEFKRRIEAAIAESAADAERKLTAALAREKAREDRQKARAAEAEKRKAAAEQRRIRREQAKREKAARKGRTEGWLQEVAC